MLSYYFSLCCSVAYQGLTMLLTVISVCFPYYLNDCKHHLSVCHVLLWNFLTSIIVYYYTLCCHLFFLESQRLNQGYEGLLDITGTYWSSLPRLDSFSNLVSSPFSNSSSSSSLLSLSVMGFTNNLTGNPSHFPISSLSLSQMWKILDDYSFRYETSVFLDFGCGVGMTILNTIIMKKPFQSIIGVEIIEKTAEMAKRNIEKYQKNNNQISLKTCSTVIIERKDMIDFQLPSFSCLSSNDFVNNGIDKGQETVIKGKVVLTENGTTENSHSAFSSSSPSSVLLFMYEPLWTMRHVDADKIYRKVLRNLKSQCSSKGCDLYIMYFFAGVYGGNALPAIKDCNGKLIHVERYYSLFFGAKDYLYFYHIPK
jgi:SAM-dependent methyltransferase